LLDRGWQAPAYRLPANREDVVIQRVVVGNGFTRDVAGMPCATSSATWHGSSRNRSSGRR